MKRARTTSTSAEDSASSVNVFTVLMGLIVLGLGAPVLVTVWRQVLELNAIVIGVIAMLAGVIGFAVFGWVQDRREARDLELDRQRICTRCGYDCKSVRGDRCPECGNPIAT